MDKAQSLKQLGDHLAEIRQSFSVKTLSVFGSLARDEAIDGSDIDVLVEFEQKASFDKFMDLKFYLEELLGVAVDLVTKNALRPQIRSAIEQEIINIS